MAITFTVAELGIDTPTALGIAAIPDVGIRRQRAAEAATDRRAELGLLAQLLHERDGRAPSAAKLEREDAALADLIVLAVA